MAPRSKPSAGTASTDKTALYVRLPNALAAEIDRQARQSGRSKQVVVTEILTDGTTQTTVDPAITGDVILNLDEAAELLRIDADSVVVRAKGGDFPARFIGDEWRFSRSAILAWLAGSDGNPDRRAGFA